MQIEKLVGKALEVQESDVGKTARAILQDRLPELTTLDGLFTAIINNKVCDLDTVVYENDTIKILPLIAGG